MNEPRKKLDKQAADMDVEITIMNLGGKGLLSRFNCKSREENRLADPRTSAAVGWRYVWSGITRIHRGRDIHGLEIVCFSPWRWSARHNESKNKRNTTCDEGYYSSLHLEEQQVAINDGLSSIGFVKFSDISGRTQPSR